MEQLSYFYFIQYSLINFKYCSLNFVDKTSKEGEFHLFMIGNTFSSQSNKGFPKTLEGAKLSLFSSNYCKIFITLGHHVSKEGPFIIYSKLPL